MAHNPQLAEYHGLKKGEEESHSASKKAKASPHLLVLLISLASCSLLLAPGFLFTCSLHLPYIFDKQYVRRLNSKGNGAPCSSAANHTICCDRSNYHSDICFMGGDLRTHSPSSSILLYSSDPSFIAPPEERIRPYTRKWEAAIRDSIDELRLRFTGAPGRCDVRHDVPALFFSAGGYTGNIFHAFNNGIIPLYITSYHLNRRVVLVVLQYRDWWYSKYGEILSRLSDYPPVDFFNDTRTHCFPSAIVGLRFHDTLAVDPGRTNDNKTAADFQHLLDEAYMPRQSSEPKPKPKPKLVIISRTETRVIVNEEVVVELGKKVGFEVEVLRPENTVAMAGIYRALSSSDVMMGVHGAALTHFLFMRPGSVFIQIVPLGTDGVAWSCFGEPAVKLGLRYEEYKILPRESSLYGEYGEGDPVVQDPESVKAKGWEVTKGLYLQGQNVTVDLGRLNERLVRAFLYAVSKRETN